MVGRPDQTKGALVKVLSFDIGGTKMEAALIEFSEQKGQGAFPYRNKSGDQLWGKILERKRIPTERDNG